MTFSLTVNKSNVNKGESVTFTSSGMDGEIKLFQKGILGDTKISVANAVNGIATFVISPTDSHNYIAMHTYIPGISECGFLCDYSNEVSVSVAGGVVPETIDKVIIALVIVIIIYIFLNKRK